MPDESNLPAQIADAVSSIPKALIPTSVKAFDRLVGAAVDIPVAWLAQKKAKIEAQTTAYTLVESAIAKVAAENAALDEQTVANAVSVLVRKSYRHQLNREAVAAAAIDDLSSTIPTENAQPSTNESSSDLDEDWLNVFERYAEDASTERMQNLWGRVLAGEIRRPGRFSTRTLRFLSEFSQADGLSFSHFSASAFGNIAPTKALLSNDDGDVREYVYLESSGLIQGASGGLTQTLTFNESGNAIIREGNLGILFKGLANSTINHPVFAITPLGQELISLLPNRDARSSAKKVAEAIRTPSIEAAYLVNIPEEAGQAMPMEILWQAQDSLSSAS